jgi:hypothetical protein
MLGQPLSSMRFLKRKYNMERLKRGDKIYKNADETKESEVNHFLDCIADIEIAIFEALAK